MLTITLASALYALHLTTTVPARSTVSMGLFASIKQVLDSVEDPKSADAVHILMKSRKDALLLKEQIDGGGIGFSEAARQYSTCPSGAKGGSLGRFRPGQMVPAFDALAFDPETELGEINVCSTQFGTHLVKVLERTGVTPAATAAGGQAAVEAAEAAEVAAEAESSADPLRAAAEVAAEAAEATAAAEEVPAGGMMEVVCPSSLAADRSIRIALPDAREFDVVVPEGVSAGESFLVGPFP